MSSIDWDRSATALRTHTVVAVNRVDCVLQCQGKRTCFSVNYNRHLGEGGHLCELNICQAYSDNTALIEREGYDYIEIEHDFVNVTMP